MHKILLYSLIGILSLGWVGCNLLTPVESDSNYPTTYSVVPFQDLQQMNEEYQDLNGNHICSTLNKYGFTGFSDILFENGQNPCDRSNREVVRIEMNRPDTFLAATKKALLKNSVYTGVEDTSALRLREMSPQPGCINCGRPDEYSANIEWRLVFENQLVDTIEVPDTEIVVFIDALGVNRIWGNWFADIEIPPFVNYGYQNVQQGLPGLRIDMRPFTGEASIYIVREEDLTERPHKVFLPSENEEGNLEIRYCWAIAINHEGEGFAGWWAYIDIEEGILVDLVGR